MSRLTDALNRILNWYEENYHEDIQFIKPGLTYSEIKQKIKELPFHLSKEFYEFYQFPNITFNLFLDEALELYYQRQNDNDWNPHWFPIFADEGHKGYISYAIVGNLQEQDTSLVLGLCLDSGLPYIAYSSLTEMLLAKAEIQEIVAINYQEREQKIKEINQKYNLESSFPENFLHETIQNLDGTEVEKYYYPNGDIYSSTTTGRGGYLKEHTLYYRGKIVERQRWNYELEGFELCFCDEKWYGVYTMEQLFYVLDQNDCGKGKMYRRYVDGILQKEVIYPD